MSEFRSANPPLSGSRVRRYGTAGALALLGLTLTGCGNTASKVAANDGADSKVKVPVLKPVRRTLARKIEQPGYVKPYEETPIYSKIAGFLDKEPTVDKGSEVHTGDLLVQLRVPEMEADLRSKQARVRQSAAEVVQAQESLNAASANVKTADSLVKEAEAGVNQSEAERKRWQAEWERAKKLLAQNVFDKQTLEEALNQLQQAEATLDRSKARVVSAQANLTESKAKEGKARADIEGAKAKADVAAADTEVAAAMLDYRNIRAPYNGVITQRNVHTGHFEQPAASGPNSHTPLFTIMRIDKLRITVQVPEFDAVLVQNGTPASVRFQALSDGDREFTGTVTRSTVSLDERARTLMVEIDLPNTPKKELRPGMYANVTITANIPDVWTLPNDALVSDEGGKYFCYCVENGKAVRTAVRAGVRTARFTQLVKKQVKTANPDEPLAWVEFAGNEQVVARNASSLTDGQAVTPTEDVPADTPKK